MIKLPEWLHPDDPNPQYREWKIAQQKALADFADGCFRCVEMTLVVGAVRYLEIWTNSPQRTSIFLSGLIAIFVQARLSQMLFPAIERYDLSERNRKRLYWAFWGLGTIAAVAANGLVHAVMPFVSAKSG